LLMKRGVMYLIMMNVLFSLQKLLRNGKKIELGSIIHVHGWMALCCLYETFYKMKLCFQKLRLLLQYTVSLLKGLWCWND
jgi:hypothetical protein